MISREIFITNNYKYLRYDADALRNSILFLDKVGGYRVEEGELSIVFMGDGEIQQIHLNFLEDNTPTDVITFPGDALHEFAGEICISVDHAISNAEAHNTSFSEELTLYIIHGWLHLCGYNDETEEEKKEMRLAEAHLMKVLKDNNLMPVFSVGNL